MELGRDLAQADREAAAPQRLEGHLQRLDQRADVLDTRAQRLEAPGGGLDQRAHLGVGLHWPKSRLRPIRQPRTPASSPIV